jgi:uncharacterized protein (DUF983 family)
MTISERSITGRPGIFHLLKAGASLRCPRCGRGKVFDGFFRMRRECPLCRLVFEREQGFFVGAIYVNYAATVLIAMPGFFLLDHYAEASLSFQLFLWGAFALVFPILFFRHSKSLWLSAAYAFHPQA